MINKLHYLVQFSGRFRMSNVKNNQRAQRTRSAIEQAFFKQAAQLPLQKITVSQIVDDSCISRGTFYLHYRDVYDLAEKICDQVLSELEKDISRCMADDSDPHGFPILRLLFAYVADHREQAGFIFSKNAPARARARATELMNESFQKVIGHSYGKIVSAQQPFFQSYVNAGLLGLLESWLAEGCPSDPGHMAMLAGMITTRGVEGMQINPIPEAERVES